MERSKLAKLDTCSTGAAEPIIYDSNIPRGCQHPGTIALSLHGTAAALTTIAYRIKSFQHRVLEKSVVDMPSLMFFF